METIKNWWRQIDTQGTMAYEQPTAAICSFMVKKKIAQDK